MKAQAVIFDVYQTLIQIGLPPADAETRWEQLCRAFLLGPPGLALAEFGELCQGIVARHHAQARMAGVDYPEVYWPDVTGEALPAIRSLPAPQQAEFLFQHVQLIRSIQLMPGAARLLRRLARQDVLLGILSNAQPYTHREFQSLLAPERLTLEMFRPELCFWSWQQGFSKPNPHAFRILTARLAAHSIPPTRILMVGDRLDNDLQPARAQGWQAFQIREDNNPAEEPGGDWAALGRFLGLDPMNSAE